MVKLKIYLAGTCRDAPDGGTEWRREAASRLRKCAEWDGIEIEVVDPTKYFNWQEKNYNNIKQVKAYYMSRIRKCDLLLVNLKDTATSVGTGQECQFAVDHGIPIIAFNDENSYPWISEVDADVVLKDLDSAIDYIMDYYF